MRSWFGRLETEEPQWIVYPERSERGLPSSFSVGAIQERVAELTCAQRGAEKVRMDKTITNRLFIRAPMTRMRAE